VKFPGASEFRKALEHDTAALLDSVLDAAESRDLAVYAVGGPVRDLLLGKAIRDVDLLLETGCWKPAMQWRWRRWRLPRTLA